jgi:hypothetical protein
MAGVLEKLRGNKNILKLDEVDTPYGPGYAAEVKIGNTVKKCTLIQDKATGEWKPEMGDPAACRILKRNLADLGSPLNSSVSEGPSESEQVREQPV